MLKWKVGATYLDTPNSLTQDDDYVDVITHELEFVPKKEVHVMLTTRVFTAFTFKP